jgi:uncharacterized protein (TIGR03435 family)
MRRFLATVLVLAPTLTPLAQSLQPTAALSFEVASVKPSPGGGPATPPGAVGPPVGGTVRYPRGSLRTLVMYAYDVLPQRHDPLPVGGPAWADADLYEVQAKGPADLSFVDARLMMRTLLEERFKLRAHVERREMPLYALIPLRPDGRLGAGMRPGKIDCSRFSEVLTRTGRGALAKQEGPDCGLSSGGAPAVAASLGVQNTAPRGAQMIRGIATMKELVTALSRDRELDRPIVDRTGLTGTYEFDLTWVPARSGVIVADPGDIQPLEVAVQQQLGLKMESRREPRDVVVIDSAEKPTPD